ncbi:MAG: flavocytochrome c, partial [Pseudoflavonifractor sp.]
MKKNKLLALLLATCMTLTLAACGAPAAKPTTAPSAAPSAVKDGSYKGEGVGKGGKIEIEVAIAGDKITGITVLSHNETPGLADAMITLTDEIVTTNSVEVDTVAGCTLTSDGFLQAVNAALAAAGAPAELFHAAAAAGDKTLKAVSESHDVVVIGSGGAGLAAAIEAKAAGADVIILEKMPTSGGNTRISGAEMAAPGNWIQKRDGIEDSVDLFYNDILTGGDNKNDPALVRIVAEGALGGAEWLRDTCNVTWENDLMFFGGHSVMRSLIPQGASGVEIIDKMIAKVAAEGIPVLYSTKATELISEGGKVTGVKAEGNGNAYTITAKNVILATGGFGANVEMRVKYNPEIDGSILSTNSVGSTGDGIVMGEAVGAGLTGMEYIQTYPICDPLSGALLYFDDARLYGHSLIVNKEGKRFVEELGRRDVMSMAIKAQTGSVCYELIDQKGFDESKILENHGPEVDYLYSNKMLVKADTLEEAAKFFGIDEAEFLKTVANYNTYVKDGKDPEFNKRKLTNPIENGPFYIVEAAPAVHHTMGGLTINT